MPKTITETHIRQQGGKLIAIADWEDGDKKGSDKKSFDDFNTAQEWLNDQKSGTEAGNPQAQTIHAAASHNLDLVIDQLESVRHSALKDTVAKLKAIKDDLAKVEL